MRCDVFLLHWDVDVYETKRESASGTFCPVERKTSTSSLANLPSLRVKKVCALPARPARPVRPIRWTYSSTSLGKS